jgi:methionyl aminopeptidase
MIVSDEKDLQGMMRIGKICGLTLKHMLDQVEPGMTTGELDRIGAAFLQKHGAASAPITAYKYPGWTCISLNDEAAHGIPGQRKIKAGDVINVDVSAVLEGYWGDTGASMIVPPADQTHRRLLDTTKDALYAAIAEAKAGAPIHNIGRVVEKIARKHNYRIIKQLSGHGVGRHIHEDPNVPNFFVRSANTTLRNGLVITIEPFLNLGRGRIITDQDGWTLRTPDKSISAQYEHTVIINGDAPILATKVVGGH